MDSQNTGNPNVPDEKWCELCGKEGHVQEVCTGADGISAMQLRIIRKERDRVRKKDKEKGRTPRAASFGAVINWKNEYFKRYKFRPNSSNTYQSPLDEHNTTIPKFIVSLLPRRREDYVSSDSDSSGSDRKPKTSKPTSVRYVPSGSRSNKTSK
jgi:hypothetical protein